MFAELGVLARDDRVLSVDEADVTDPTQESAPEDEEPDANAEWLAEIERRARRVLAGQGRGVPWEEVRARIERRLEGGSIDRTR